MFCFQPKRKTVIGTQSTEHKASLFAQQVFWTLAVRPEPLWSGLAELQTTLCSCQQISKALRSDSEVALTHSSFWWTQRSSSGNIHQRSHPHTEADRSGLDRQWQTWLGRAVAADHGRAGEEVTGRAWALPFCTGRHSNVCVHVPINTQTTIYHSQMMSSQMTGAEPWSECHLFSIIWHSTLSLARPGSYSICQNIARQCLYEMAVLFYCLQ